MIGVSAGKCGRFFRRVIDVRVVRLDDEKDIRTALVTNENENHFSKITNDALKMFLREIF
jgi:hypothetical protein